MQALQQATAKNAALEEQFNNQARKSADEYQAKIACLDAQYRTAGTHEMRIAVAGCRPADAGPAATQSAGKSDAASSGTIPPAATAYLPAITQQQLLDLAHDADEQCTRLQTLQDWIRGAGLY